MDDVVMSCSGCGDQIALNDPSFSEWWTEHGKCLLAKYRGEPPPEIDRNVKAILDDRRRP